MTWLFVILTVLLWGSAPIFEKVGLSKATPYQAVVVRSLVIAILVFFGAIVSGRFTEAFRLETKTLVFVIIGGLFAGLLGQLTYFNALKGAEASKVIPLTAAFPLVTTVLGVVILNESFSWEKLAGVMLVITGAVLLR